MKNPKTHSFLLGSWAIFNCFKTVSFVDIVLTCYQENGNNHLLTMDTVEVRTILLEGDKL